MKSFHLIAVLVLSQWLTATATPPLVLDTTIHQLEERRVIIERAPGIILPDPPEPVARPAPEPETAERLAEYAALWRAQRISHPTIHAGATVYRLPDGKTVTHVTNWSVNNSPMVSFWSSADFSLVAHPGGFTYPSIDGDVNYTILLFWSSHDIAMWEEFMAKRGREYEPPDIPEFPEGPATWILDENEKSQIPDAATERAIAHIHEHHNGNLFDPENPAHHPHADPDGDGWTNLEEFIAGTDPFSGNPPEGMVATHITHLPDQPAAEGGIVDVAIISWDTLPGKQYTLQFSPDLTGQSWIAVDVPYAGDGTPEAVSITLTDSEGVAPDKLFWRVKVDDPNTDSDGDGLTDYEEYLLGSDPNNPDTSGDGVPDGWLVAHGYDPNVNHENIMFRDTGVTVPEAYLLGVQPNPDATLRDLDGDGLTNEQEAFLGTDPLVPDNPGILQEKISNGDFSEPAIGTGAREGAAWMAWDYWPSEKVKGWKAIEGDHIEFQTYRPLEAGTTSRQPQGGAISSAVRLQGESRH